MDINLGNIGKVTVEIDFPVKTAALVAGALVVPIVVFFILKIFIK